jgi:tetratricopeptide (TPR) repeat protein
MTVLRSSRLLAFLLAVSFTPAAAQHAGHRASPVPVQVLERPIALASGIGQASDGAITTNAEAQRYYDQGLAYLHSYVWIDAARSFHQALRLDASLALAHVGLSVALVELSHPAAAAAAMDRARGLAANASPHARWHVENRDLQLAAENAPGDKTRFAAWRDHLDRALAALPDDVELILLRGVAESGDPADRGQGSLAASAPFFERALKKSPNHFAAQHYLAHAMENSGRAADALPHARAYAAAAPQVPHARHMHGHSLRRLGRAAEAIAEFRAADRLHREAAARDGLAAADDRHYAHNLDLLGLSLQHQGQLKAAEPVLKQSFALPTTLLVQLVNKREWPRFLVIRGRLDEALAAAGTLISDRHPAAQATGHVEAGFVHLAARRYADAAAASNAALKAVKQAGPTAGLVMTSLKRLQGEFLLRTAARDKGRAAMSEAAAALGAARGPDNWSEALFALEAMTRTAREVGDWELAARLSQQMIDHDPAYGGSHFERGMVARHDGRDADADAAFALARKYWAGADRDLPQFTHMGKR